VILCARVVVIRRQARNAAFVLAWAALAGGCRDQGTPPAVFEGVSLVDEDGATLAPSSLANQPLLLNFFFTSCPVVCPRQTEGLAAARAALPPAVRQHVRFLSVSVDPENDTPSALQRYAQAHGADQPGWSFARSDEAGTKQLRERLAASAPGAAAEPSAHDTHLYLFDRGGQLVQRYRGAPLDVPHLVRELVSLDEVKPSGTRLARN
jgi:protein SCO1